MLGTESDPGLIRRSIDTIFQRIAELSHQKEFLMRVSYLEIYNEHVNDLFVEVSWSIKSVSGGWEWLEKINKSSF